MTRRFFYQALLLALAATLLLPARAARAEMSTRELFDTYDTGDAEMRALLERVIDGNSNGVSWVNSYLDEFRGSTHQIYCPPDDFTTNGAGMIGMMRKAAVADPRYYDLPYGATVMFAYIYVFPCP